MTYRLVSFLGLGQNSFPHYTPVHWELDGRATAHPLPLVPAAICELVPEIDDVILIGTAEAQARWFGEAEIIRQWLPSCRFATIPKGQDVAEGWNIFETVRRELSAETSGATPKQVLLDVTHGFRAQPMLGLAAANFAISEWARAGESDVPKVRVLYGAFEPGSSASTFPIWDLTQILVAAQWNSAIDALLRFGRADSIEQLSRLESQSRIETKRSQRDEIGRADSFPRTLGLKAREFVDALALGRMRALFGKAVPELARALGAPEARAWLEELPPLRAAFARLQDVLEKLQISGAELQSPSTQQAWAEAAMLSGKFQQFAMQANLVSEGLLTAAGLLACGPGAFVERGNGSTRRARQQVEGELSVIISKDGARRHPLLGRALSALADFKQTRNDVAHCGLSDSERSAPELRERLQQAAKGLAELVQELPPMLPVPLPQSPGGCFLNLSNHPLCDWSEEQLRQARALGHGEPRDLEGGMPQVDARATTEVVREQARNIAALTVAHGAVAAHVAGEPVLSLALVAELQRRQLICYAATTERQAESETRPDGSVSVRRLFRFIQWRPYPTIGVIDRSSRLAPRADE